MPQRGYLKNIDCGKYRLQLFMMLMSRVIEIPIVEDLKRIVYCMSVSASDNDFDIAGPRCSHRRESVKY